MPHPAVLCPKENHPESESMSICGSWKGWGPFWDIKTSSWKAFSIMINQPREPGPQSWGWQVTEASYPAHEGWVCVLLKHCQIHFVLVKNNVIHVKDERVLKSDAWKWKNMLRATWLPLFIWHQVCFFVAFLKVGILTLLLLPGQFFKWPSPQPCLCHCSLRGAPQGLGGWEPGDHILPPLPTAATNAPAMLLSSIHCSGSELRFAFFPHFSVFHTSNITPSSLPFILLLPFFLPRSDSDSLDLRQHYLIWRDFFREGFISSNGKYGPSFC